MAGEGASSRNSGYLVDTTLNDGFTSNKELDNYKKKTNIYDLGIDAVKNFINEYQDIHLEIAADYLVMAAWLTYLKSRLLLPKGPPVITHLQDRVQCMLRIQNTCLRLLRKRAHRVLPWSWGAGSQSQPSPTPFFPVEN